MTYHRISCSRQQRRLLTAVLVIVLSPEIVGAQEGSDVDKAIEEMIVVGNQMEETIPLDLREYGNRVQVISAEEIELAGFNDLSQLLQMKVPGLYLAPKNGAFDYMSCSLQGSRCQDVLWLIDGVRINNRLYNSTSPLDTVPAHIVERVEVLYGGQGIFYGTQSVAGVVNVVTKAFGRGPAGSVSIGADENDAVHVNFDYRTSIGDHNFVVYASKDNADGFQPFAAQDYQASGTDRARGYDVFTVGMKYAYRFNDRSHVTFHYHLTENEVDWAAPANRASSFNERSEDLVTVKWEYTVSENVELFVKGYFHDWDSHWTQIDNELDINGQLTGNQVVISDREYWGYEDYGVTAMARIGSDYGLDYVAGYEHQRFSGSDQVLLIADQTEHVNAAFVQVRTNADLMEKTRIALGARHNQPSGEGHVTVWNLSGQHDFNPSLYTRATVGTSFRFPDAWQLYGNDPCCTLGNPDLEGEQSTNYNVAIGGQTEMTFPVSWELIWFTREVDGLIGSANGIRINSDAVVDFDGWEFTVGLTLTDSISATIDYTSTDATAAGSAEQIVDIPESTLKASFSYLPRDLPYEIDMSLVHIGDIYDSVSGGIGRVEHGNYTVFDIGGAYYPGESRSHRLSLRLENVFDENYASSLGRAFADSDGSSYAYRNLGTPRTVKVAYTYRF